MKLTIDVTEADVRHERHYALAWCPHCARIRFALEKALAGAERARQAEALASVWAEELAASERAMREAKRL